MGSIQILDGGLGTSLEDKYGVIFNHSKPLWSTHFLIDDKDTLLACQRDFANAGTDILLTATYQTSVEGFSRTKTADFVDGIPKSAIGGYLLGAIEIAEKARICDSTSLALSLGPYGACMLPGQEYSGKYDARHNSHQPLYQWHLERLQLFTTVEGLLQRVQYVALETVPRLDEIRALRKAVLSAGISAPFWISCVFPGEGNALPDGSDVNQVIEAMLDPAIEGAIPWGIGINCTKIHKLPGLIGAFETCVQQLLSSGRIPSAPALVLYPDGTNGEVYNTATQKWEMPEKHGKGEEQRASLEESWAARLAKMVRESQCRGCFQSFVVGGCCKASAVDIRDLRDSIRD
ncbi:putative homocysteine S-methyltransferase, partial [Xylariales sp. AK1849]